VFEFLHDSFPWLVIGYFDYYSTVLWHLKDERALASISSLLIDCLPDRRVTWIALGNYYSLRKEHSSSLACFNKALKIDPTCSYAYILSGHDNIAAENYDEAVQSFTKAMQLDPQDSNPLYPLPFISLHLCVDLVLDWWL